MKGKNYDVGNEHVYAGGEIVIKYRYYFIYWDTQKYFLKSILFYVVKKTRIINIISLRKLMPDKLSKLFLLKNA